MCSNLKLFIPVKFIILMVIILCNVSAFSQIKKILVYHETNGFRHNSINSGIQMFQELGAEDGDWTVDDSRDSSVFTPENLAQYSAVVFLNTSGSDEAGGDGDLLSSSEKLAFENFIASGNGFIGVHAATDTYRDKVWPFYNELVGAIVQTSPNHTANNLNRNQEVKSDNWIISFLGPIGSIWNKSEEYYYWEQNGGQLSPDNTVLLEVEETVDRDGVVNSYDAARPTTWYKESITFDDDNNVSTPDVTLSGIKSFYTALGHNSSDYSSNTNFRTMLKNATLWAIGSGVLNLPKENDNSKFSILTNPVNDNVQISVSNTKQGFNLKIFDITGKEVLVNNIKSSEISNNAYNLDLSNYKAGLYFFLITTDVTTTSFKVVKK